jgi:hypothetical protein
VKSEEPANTVADPSDASSDAVDRKKSVQRRRKRQARSGSLLKWVIATCGVLLALLLIALFAGRAMIKSWLHGDGFRDRLVAKLESTLQAEVNVEDLHWQDSSLYIAGLEAHGYRDAAMARISVDGVRGSFDGARDQAWQVPDITLNQLRVEFSDDRLPQRAETVLDDDDAAASLQSVPGFLRRWVPQRAEIGVVRIDATNLSVKGDGARPEVFALRAVETASKPISGSRGGWRIQGRGGDMHIAGQPELGIEGFDLRWVGSDVYVNRSTLEIYENGRINADGEVRFGEMDTLDLRLELSGIDCSEVLDETWAERASGTISGVVEVEGEIGGAGEGGLAQSGTLKVDNAVLKDLPVLKKIATYTQSPKFDPLFLHQAEMDFERSGDRLVISNLVLESNGLTRLEGSMTLNGDVIESGKFRLGVTPGTLSMIPGAERKVFVEAEGGFLWTDVEVVGTLSQPKENLSQRLVGAAIEAVIEDTPGKVLDTAKDALQNPTGTAGGLLEKGGEALKGFVPFFK